MLRAGVLSCQNLKLYQQGCLLRLRSAGFVMLRINSRS